MRIPNHVRGGGLGINMTPMIDVVFLLLIFFLVSGHLAKRESQLKLNLPTAESGEADKQDEAPRITINVRPDGALLLAGHITPPEELAARLQERAAQSGSGLEVRIRSDRAVPYRQMEPILQACARANLWNVTFAVYKKNK